jgi:ABC-type transport system involved in Fe-S cluster assembly fused permease/ATPase subunit
MSNERDEEKSPLLGERRESYSIDVHKPINDHHTSQASNTAPVAKGQTSALGSAAAADETTEDEKPAVVRPIPMTSELAARRQFAVIRFLMLAGVPTIVALYGIGSNRLGCGDYDITRSSCDVAGASLVYTTISVLLLIACSANRRRGLFDNKLPITDVIHHVTVLYFLGVSSKIWIYAWGRDDASDGNAIYCTTLVLLTTVSSIASMWAIHRVHRCDVAPTVNVHWKSMLRILKPYFWPAGVWNRLLILATWGLMGAGKACGVVAPLFLADAVNQLQATPAEAPYGNLAIFTALSLAPRVLEELQDMLVVNIWRVAYIEVAAETFQHIHRLSLEWHLQKRMGHVIRYMDRGMNAATQLVSYVAMYFGPAVAVAISAFVVFATEFSQPQIAAATYLFMGFYMWMSIVVTIWRKMFFTEANEHDNDMHDKATDSLVNFETVKYFTNEDLELENYVKSVSDYQMNEQKSRLSIAVLNMGQATLIEYCRMVALMIGATAVMNNEDGFDLGKFMALQAYLVLIFTPFQFLGSIYEMAVESLVDMENLSELLLEEPDLVDAPHAKPLAPTPHIARASATPKSLSVEFRNVTFRYPSQGPQLGIHDISFTVNPGTTTALVGTTGSGKTTITRLLFRFYDTLSGSVRVGGEDVRDITQKSLRQHIGIVPQDTVLFNDTIRWNIRYGRPDATDEEVEEAARQAQVLPLILRLENGWDTVVGERGLKLSGGEKQRVAIARCLLKNPPIVVLDEATSALDNKTEREVQEALRALAGRTTIVVAHRLSTVQHANDIIVLKYGRIVERGTFAQLVATGGEFFEMWNTQQQPDSSVASE